MDIIKSYLDQCFARLPQTPGTLRMKEELLSAMEDKYHELKAAGKPENEVIGTVIAEFGNVDELYAALEFSGDAPGRVGGSQPELPLLDEETAERFMDAKNRVARFIGLGVFLCILAPTALILQSIQSAKWSGLLGLTMLFSCVAVAVSLFILGGSGMSAFEFLEKGSFHLAPHVRNKYMAEMAAFRPRWIIALVVAVGLFILSPLAVILLAETAYTVWGVALLLLMVALGVFLCVRFGIVMGAFHILLQMEDYAPDKKESEKAVGILASIWWPVATAVFFIWGFVYNGWDRAWIVWPVAGVLFAAVSSIVGAVTKKPDGSV